MADVRFAQASRIYPGTDAPAVDALDLHIQDGELVVLVGPSGSGKTTALRMLAGLEEVDAGAVLIGGRDVTDVAPKRRDVAMVFQNYALYPYLTVEANIAFPLRIAKVKKSERARRVARGRRAARPDRVPAAQARPALRRPAAARRDGPRDRARAERLPDGRAALQPRREAARPDAGRHRRAPVAARRHHGLRHPRPVRGDDARPSRRGAEGRAAAAVRRAADAVRASGEHVRRRLHRLAGDEPLRAPARSERLRALRRRVRRAARRRRPAGAGSCSACGRSRSRSRARACRRASRWSRRSAPTRTSSASPRSPARRSSSSPAARRGCAPSGTRASTCGRERTRRTSSIRRPARGSRTERRGLPRRDPGATGGAAAAARAGAGDRSGRGSARPARADRRAAGRSRHV